MKRITGPAFPLFLSFPLCLLPKVKEELLVIFSWIKQFNSTNGSENVMMKQYRQTQQRIDIPSFRQMNLSINQFVKMLCQETEENLVEFFLNETRMKSLQ